MLTSEAISRKLELSEEQLAKLSDESIDNMYDLFDSMQDFRSMSDQERIDAAGKLIESRDTALLAVLTDEQKQSFEKMKGEKIKIDHSKLPRPGRL